MRPAANEMCRSAAETVRRRMCDIFCLGLFLVLFASGILFADQLRRDVDDAVVGIRVRTRTMIVGPEGDPFNMPSDAAVGSKGYLYVLDGVNHRVVVYDAEGKFRFTFGNRGIAAGEFTFPLGITTGPDGNIYVADSGNHRFQIFTAAGKPLIREHRDYWKKRWQDMGMPLNKQSTFRWTLIPETLDYLPGEHEGGNIVLPFTDKPISITATFSTGDDKQGKKITITTDKLFCAEDGQ